MKLIFSELKDQEYECIMRLVDSSNAFGPHLEAVYVCDECIAEHRIVLSLTKEELFLFHVWSRRMLHRD